MAATEQTTTWITHGNPDVALRGVGMTINTQIDGGVFKFEPQGAGYEEKRYDSVEEFEAALADLYVVDVAEGYFSETGIVSLVDELANRQSGLQAAYAAWTKADRPNIAKSVSEEFAEAETRKRFGAAHGKWLNAEQIAAGDLELGVRKFKTTERLSKAATKALIAAARKGEGGGSGAGLMSDCGSKSSYTLSLNPNCGVSDLWEHYEPPTGCEDAQYTKALDGDGCYYVRTSWGGGWRRVWCPSDGGDAPYQTPAESAGGDCETDGTVDPDPDPMLCEKFSITVNGQTYDELDCNIQLPDYPVVGVGGGLVTDAIVGIKVNGEEQAIDDDGCVNVVVPVDTDTDTDTHVQISYNGTALTETAGNVDLPVIKVNGVTVAPDANNCIDIITSATADPFDLCELPVRDEMSPCCGDAVAMCKSVVDDDGNVTDEVEAALVPLGHLIAPFAALDINNGVANTCPGQQFYVQDPSGCYRLYLNAGVPDGATDPLVFCYGIQAS